MKTTIFNKTLAIATMVVVMVGMCSCEKKYVDGQLQGNLKVSNIYFEPTRLPQFDDMVVCITKRNDKLYFDIQNYLMQIGTRKVSINCKMSNDTLSINYNVFDSGINGLTGYDGGFCTQPVTLSSVVIKDGLLGACSQKIALRENEAVEVYRRKYNATDE